MARRHLLRSSPLLFLGAIAAGAFLVLFGVSLVQELRRRYLLDRHIQALRAEIEARERNSAELRRLKEYFGTDAYVERVARDKLNYQAPGEHVVVVPEARRPAEAPPASSLEPVRVSPARAWLELLFGPP